MDSVEKLFSAMKDPENIPTTDGPNEVNQFTMALQEFINGPPSEDDNYRYLLAHGQRAFDKGVHTSTYFGQQLAQMAAHAVVPRKDKSQKTRQMKYHRWLAHGLKTETYPFSTRKPQGPPSTARLVTLVNPTSCAACGKIKANMRCPGCAFHDNRHILSKTAYCNKKCLTDHSNAHRRVCEGRKMVYRAASLLDFIFGAMEEATYIYPLELPNTIDGIVYLFDDIAKERAGMTGRRLFHSFPKNADISVDMKRALLFWGQADQITVTLYSLVMYMFKPICKQLDLVFIQPKNVIAPICQVSDGKAHNYCLCKYTVLKLKLLSGEEYIIDLSGAQFGWKETLAPWAAWTDLRASKIETVSFAPAPASLISEIQQNTLEALQYEVRVTLVKSIVKELGTALHANTSSRSFDKVLKSDAEDYQRAENDIMEMVRQRIYVLVTTKYHKDAYRLWLQGGPCYGVQIAREHAKVLKTVWLTGKEYDRLKDEGTDMRTMWSQRIEGKIKGNPRFKGKCCHAHGASAQQGDASTK